MFKVNQGRNALLALVLLVPAPSIGVATQLYILPGLFGHLVALLSKIWLLVVPIVWLFYVDKGDLKIQFAKGRDLLAGVGLGLLMFSIISIAYWLLRSQWIDVEFVRDRARQVGLNSLTIYSVGAAYWIFINSLLEEFVWRYFVYRKCEILVPSPVAVVLSALLFTIHHTIGLVAYFDWRATTLGSLGVFLAGAVWSWCYLTYRSIWPGYISHIFADIAIFMVGLQLLFG
ncbi:CPBP family intramembrane glutamic endopeptidase [Scytonema sp. NUACC26]|uniref:CPBP family intramembrane glutamic endopeptidase n=1 Tax=Scytonema sp. NUACC26 TaxID=3140176 RepID=UPI0034DBDFD9